MARGIWRILLIAWSLALLCAAPAFPQDASPRVVAGSAVEIEDHPYQVQLKEALSGLGFCGGSIYDATHVITAAHCVVVPGDVYPEIDDPANLKVGYGHENEAQLTTVDVAQVNVHPAYLRGFSFDPSFDSSDFDVALLTLETPGIPLDNTPPTTQNAIPIPSQGERDVATDGFVTGWGDLFEGAGTGSPLLQGVEVPLRADSVCQTVYGSDYVAGRMECAGGTSDHVLGEPDTCQGDSGGPLAIDTTQDNPDSTKTWELIGITSFGEGCGRDNVPGVYSQVLSADHLPFLTQSSPSAPPSPPAPPTISGTPAVGQALTCNPTQVAGLTVTRYLWFIVDSGDFTEIPGQNASTLVVPSSAQGASIACDVRYEKPLSGFTYAFMDETDAVGPVAPASTSGTGTGTPGTGTPGTGFPFVPDTVRPSASIGRVRCSRIVGRSRRCRVRIRASDVGGLVRSLSAKVTYRVRVCRRVDGERVCTRRKRTRRLRATRTSTGFRLSFRLRPRLYRLTVVATDTSGNRSASRSKRFRVRRP